MRLKRPLAAALAIAIAVPSPGSAGDRASPVTTAAPTPSAGPVKVTPILAPVAAPQTPLQSAATLEATSSLQPSAASVAAAALPASAVPASASVPPIKAEDLRAEPNPRSPAHSDVPKPLEQTAAPVRRRLSEILRQPRAATANLNAVYDGSHDHPSLAANPASQLATAALQQRPSENAEDLLAGLYPEYSSDLRQLIPHLKSIPAAKFQDSLFADKKLAHEFIACLRKLKSILPPEEYLRWIQDARSLEKFVFPMILPRVGSVLKTTSGYKVPYRVLGFLDSVDSPSSQASGMRVAGVRLNAVDDAERKRQRLRYNIFDRLVETNFIVLERIALHAEAMTKPAADDIVSQIGEMVSSYEELTAGTSKSGDAARVRDKYERIVSEIERLWANQTGHALSRALASRIVSLENTSEIGIDGIKNLHTLVNHMHQESISLIMHATTGMGSSAIIRSQDVYLGFLDRSESPLFHKGLANNVILETLAPALDGIPNVRGDGMLIRDDQVWYHARIGEHYGEFYAKFADPDEGGMLRLRYSEGTSTDGNHLRLIFIEALLKPFGMEVKIQGGRFLTAVWDKDHGLSSPNEIKKAVPFLIGALHRTTGLDYTLLAIQGRLGMQEAEKAAKDLAAIFTAEGRWPFSIQSGSPNDLSHYANYRAYLDADAEQTRSVWRKNFNAKLASLGLPTIPEDIRFGQAVVDERFTTPIREALTRGEIILDDRGFARRQDNKPLETFAEAILEGEEDFINMATLFGPTLDSLLEFLPIGTIGTLRAERAQREFSDGSSLVVYGLREPRIGQMAYARPRLWKNGTLKDLSAQALTDYLEYHGYEAEQEEPLSPSQTALLRKLLRAPAVERSDLRLEAEGLGVSRGRGEFRTGRVTFNKAGRPGDVLIVPYTTPDDLEVIRHSAAVVTTGGGTLSHAAITTRELGLHSIILHSALWKKDTDGPYLELSAQQAEAPSPGPGGLLLNARQHRTTLKLREGDLVRVHGRSGTLSIFPSNLTRHSTFEAQEALRALPAQGAKTLSRIAWTPEAGRFTLEEALWNEAYSRHREMIIDFLVHQTNEATQKAVRLYGQEIILKASREAAEVYAATESQDVEPAITGLRKELDQFERLAAFLGLEKSSTHFLRSKLENLESVANSNRAYRKALSIKMAKRLARRTQGWGEEALPLLRRFLRRFPHAPIGDSAVLKRRQSELTQNKQSRIETMGHSVLPLEAVDDDYRGLVGGKFSKLGEILSVVRQQGAYVPDALSVTTNAYHRFLDENNLTQKISSLAARLDLGLNDTSLTDNQRGELAARISRQIRELLMSSTIRADKGVGREIWEAMSAHGLTRKDKRLAIRSSAEQEDSEEAAFAGAAESYLNVAPQEALGKVVENWASFWLPRAILYRHQQAIASSDLSPATIIQEMAEAEISGVIFTVNPVTGTSEITINAGYGLGEGIVSGIVQSDRYITRKSDGEETDMPFVGDKRRAVMPDKTGQGTRMRKIAENRRWRRSLTHEQTRQLSLIAKALEKHFGYPLDIEFAITAKGIAVLQARPVTAILGLPASSPAATTIRTP